MRHKLWTCTVIQSNCVDPEVVSRTFKELTDGLLILYEAADDPFIVLSDREAVPSEDDVEGFWNVNKREIRLQGGISESHFLEFQNLL